RLAESMSQMAYIQIVLLYVGALHSTPPCSNLGVQSALPSVFLSHSRQVATIEQIGKTYAYAHWSSKYYASEVSHATQRLAQAHQCSVPCAGEGSCRNVGIMQTLAQRAV